MPIPAGDRQRLPAIFWRALPVFGLDPASVLRHAHLPLTLCGGEADVLTTAQFFAIWRAVGDLSNDPGVGLKMGSQADTSALPAPMLAAHHARDYRDALTRHARFKQLYSSGEMHLNERKDECVIEERWPDAHEEEPPVMVDIVFATLVELGRRGTKQPLNPMRVELNRATERTGVHRAYFNCPVVFRAARSRLILKRVDLDRPFVTYNSELLEMLQPQLEKQLQQQQSRTSIIEQVKWILKRMLAGGRPDSSAVARELGLSVRTLQRRIDDEGATFRGLLAEARQELGREYLSQPGMQINEVAFLLGYEDANSFYRAFRSWEGTTPAHWRSDSSDSEGRRSRLN
jgi:AraC-like DNA-binding protein